MKKIFKFLFYAVLAIVAIIAAAYFYVGSQTKVIEQGVISTRQVPYIGIKMNDVAMKDFGIIVPETYQKLLAFKKSHLKLELNKPFTIYQKSTKSEKLANLIVGFETPKLYPNINEKEVFSGIRKSIIAMKFEAFGSYEYLPYMWVKAFMIVNNSEKYEINENEFGFETYESTPEENIVEPKDYKTIIYIPVIEK